MRSSATSGRCRRRPSVFSTRHSPRQFPLPPYSPRQFPLRSYTFRERVDFSNLNGRHSALQFPLRPYRILREKGRLLEPKPPYRQNARLRAGIERETEGVTLVSTRHSPRQFPLRPYTLLLGEGRPPRAHPAPCVQLSADHVSSAVRTLRWASPAASASEGRDSLSPVTAENRQDDHQVRARVEQD